MLADSLAAKYPKIKVTVFEQEHVIQMAKNLKPDLKINMIQGKPCLFCIVFQTSQQFLFSHVGMKPPGIGQ